MALFGNQFSNVIEWQEDNDEVIFWKWSNKEIKKGSRLIIKPGQDAILLYNGKIEGIFTEEGNYEVESQIIPFLSTLKGFKFGFNSGIRAEVLFVNTKEFTIKWGTRSSINIPYAGLPGGLPVRAFGNFHMKVSDYIHLIDTIAGVKVSYSVDEVKTRILGILDQLLMKWIVKEGKDMFNLQANAYDIAEGMKMDLDMELMKIGMSVTGLQIASFNYPEEIQNKIDSAAAYTMVGDMGKYQMGKMADSMTLEGGGSSVGNAMGTGYGMAAGMKMANEMFQNTPQNAEKPKSRNVCPKCGASVESDDKFCGSCGEKLGGGGFCPECGGKIVTGAKFCPSCGKALSE